MNGEIWQKKNSQRMRTTTTFVMVLIVSILAGCKKERTCLCGQKVSAVSFSLYDTRAGAKKNCKAMSEQYKTPCELE